MSQLKYWVWLSSLYGVGPSSAMALLRHFGTPEGVFSASTEDYKNVEGLKSADIAGLRNKDLALAAERLEACARIGCRVLTLQDADYPDRLRNIYDPPVVLYVRGSLPAIDEEPVVAIVGTRRCTPYGLKAAEKIGHQLASRGLTVATGLAIGVDSAAARGALGAGGRVIGVIGSGLDVVYPPENEDLFAEVVSSGAILSEYPPGALAKAVHFPARNRIISGVSLGVAVIEAPKKSGALITAARALEQGRDVFALPGNIDARNCEGSNLLLREGAIPILSAEDIISEYEDIFPESILKDGAGARDPVKKEIDNTPEVEYIDLGKILGDLAGDERLAAEAIGDGPKRADEIIECSGLTAQQALAALTMLEIKGYVVRLGSMWKLAPGEKLPTPN